MIPRPPSAPLTDTLFPYTTPFRSGAQTLCQQLQGKSPTDIATGWATYLGYVDFVKQRGVTEQQAKACLSDQKNVRAVVDNAQQGGEDGVKGTPSFFLNGTLLEKKSGRAHV